MSNVLKFDPEKRKKPEPEEKKPQVNNGAKFVWLSALLGPLAFSLLLMFFYLFGSIWQAVTNPLAPNVWSGIGSMMGIAFIVGAAATPFNLALLGPYAMAVNKGYVLLKTIFVKRATIAGGIFGLVAVIGINLFLAGGISSAGLSQMLLNVVLGAIAGLAAGFVWSNIGWIAAGGWKLAPQTNDNR